MESTGVQSRKALMEDNCMRHRGGLLGITSSTSQRRLTCVERVLFDGSNEHPRGLSRRGGVFWGVVRYAAHLDRQEQQQREAIVMHEYVSF